MKYRKKPVVVEAWRWNGGEIEHEGIPGWVRDNVLWKMSKSANDWKGRLLVTTLEGSTYAEPGDWLIRGIKGEVYPCKNEIFEATYESVPE